MLAVMGELSENLQKKEALEGQMKSFERLAALSTLTLTIEHDAPRPPPPPPPPRPWAAVLALRGAAREWATLLDVASGVALHGVRPSSKRAQSPSERAPDDAPSTLPPAAQVIFDLPVFALALALLAALFLCASRLLAPCARRLAARTAATDEPSRERLLGDAEGGGPD